jgi:hypothetical protein
VSRGASHAHEGQQPEALAEAVVDEPEVVPAEQAAAELDDHRRVLGAGELVIEPDAVAGLSEGHLSPP